MDIRGEINIAVKKNTHQPSDDDFKDPPPTLESASAPRGKRHKEVGKNAPNTSKNATLLHEGPHTIDNASTPKAKRQKAISERGSTTCRGSGMEKIRSSLDTPPSLTRQTGKANAKIPETTPSNTPNKACTRSQMHDEKKKTKVETTHSPSNTDAVAKPDFKRLLYRCSPRVMRDTMDKFNTAQRKSVFDMGFGAILEYAVRDLPSTMAHWCVSKYSPKHNYFQLRNGSRVKIEDTDVWLVLGLPKGDIRMKRNRKLLGNKYAEEWEIKLGRGRKKVRQSDVIQAMLGDVAGGDWFKLNFLIMIEFCLIEASSDGNVRPKIMDCLHNLSTIKNLNWCQYLLDTLAHCHTSWLKNTDGFFNGSVIFLVMFYVDRIIDASMQVERVFPSTKSWSSEMLKKRQQTEINRGYFGHGKLANRLDPEIVKTEVNSNWFPDFTKNAAESSGSKQESNRDARSYRKDVVTAACELTKAMKVFVDTLLSIPKEVSKDDQLLVTFESCRNLLNISQPNPETFGAEFFSATQQELNDTQWDAYCNESYDLYESVQKIKPLRTEDDSTGHRGSDMRYGPQSIEHTARECYSEIPNIEETECKTGDVSENMKDIEEGNTETKTDVDELLTGQMIPHDDPSIIVGNVLADLEKSGTTEDVLEPCSSEKETNSSNDTNIESAGETLAQLVQHHKGKMCIS